MGEFSNHNRHRNLNLLQSTITIRMLLIPLLSNFLLVWLKT